MISVAPVRDEDYSRTQEPNKLGAPWRQKSQESRLLRFASGVSGATARGTCSGKLPSELRAAGSQQPRLLRFASGVSGATARGTGSGKPPTSWGRLGARSPRSPACCASPLACPEPWRGELVRGRPQRVGGSIIPRTGGERGVVVSLCLCPGFGLSRRTIPQTSLGLRDSETRGTLAAPGRLGLDRATAVCAPALLPGSGCGAGWRSRPRRSHPHQSRTGFLIAASGAGCRVCPKRSGSRRRRRVR